MSIRWNNFRNWLRSKFSVVFVTLLLARCAWQDWKEKRNR